MMVVVVMMSFFCLKVSATFDRHGEEGGIETIYQVPSLGSRKTFDFSSFQMVSPFTSSNTKRKIHIFVTSASASAWIMRTRQMLKTTANKPHLIIWLQIAVAKL